MTIWKALTHSMTRWKIQSLFCCCQLLLVQFVWGTVWKFKIRVGISTAIEWGGVTFYEKPSFLWDCYLKNRKLFCNCFMVCRTFVRYLLPWLLLQEAFFHPVRTLCITEGCWPHFSLLFFCLNCPQQNNLMHLNQVQVVAFAVRNGQNDFSWFSLFTFFGSLQQHLWQCLSSPAFLLIISFQN